MRKRSIYLKFLFSFVAAIAAIPVLIWKSLEKLADASTGMTFDSF